MGYSERFEGRDGPEDDGTVGDERESLVERKRDRAADVIAVASRGEALGDDEATEEHGAEALDGVGEAASGARGSRCWGSRPRGAFATRGAARRGPEAIRARVGGGTRERWQGSADEARPSGQEAHPGPEKRTSQSPAPSPPPQGGSTHGLACLRSMKAQKCSGSDLASSGFSATGPRVSFCAFTKP